MKTRGSSEPGFQTIVAAGANSSLPHYRAGPKKLAAGKPVLIDWAAVYKGYHADMTRTFTLGKWPPKLREVYEIVLEAQQAAAAALAPGKSSGEVDGVARKIITRHGYAEFFGHGLGHGIGLTGHEEPRLTNMLAPTRLEAGMVVTVEPGIYLPGIGGVRIEDDYIITEDGAKNLCSMPKDIESCTL
jgi:Xaa-Pro aminopeptidase